MRQPFRAGKGPHRHPPPPPPPPPGPPVTYQQIDGGPTWYADNGFTYAASPSATMLANGAKGWDDPAFFPVGDDFAFYGPPGNTPGNSTATFKDLGLNYSHRVTGNTSMTSLLNAGIWAVGSSGLNTGAETVGMHLDEPPDWSTVTSDVASYGTTLQNRLYHVAFTHNQFVFGPISGDGPTMQSVCSTAISTSFGSVHINIPTADIYWFAAQNDAVIAAQGYQVATGTNGTATAAQMARGSNYGDMVDVFRSWTATYPAPLSSPYIENGEGLLTDAGIQLIKPAEMNQAAWMSIIHGARWLVYFGTTPGSLNSAQNTFGFSQAVQPGQSVSIYAQAKSTNTLVANLAAIINSPFTIGYVNVNPPAYAFPVAISPGHWWNVTGVDVMVKHYTGGPFTISSGPGAGTWSNGNYIFASYRGNATDANVGVSFSAADQYTGPVTAINADGGSASYGTTYTLSATNGVFTDTLATGLSVRIYYVP